LKPVVKPQAYWPNGKPMDPLPLEPGGYSREFSMTVGNSRHHGLMMLPMRLPQFLMPEWSLEAWSKFLESELEYFQSAVAEFAGQCLSLAITRKDEFRKMALADAF